ncbi:MAG: VWA domain-containing protein [Archangium sp.]|nr:VWA domain-containing protein [Archangium sp.]
MRSKALWEPLAVALLVASACSPRVNTIGGNVDAGVPATTATLSGQVCTAVPDPTAFPVKLVVLVDQSGSNCIIDPPGSQGSPGFCEMYSVSPPGVTQPARVRAVNKLIDFATASPNISMALVPYETNVRGVWPPFSGATRFARPDNSLRARVNTLQAELGKASDLQGALEFAHGLIASDVAALEQINPEELALTRYVVVLITDGPPEPRCSRNDSLPSYADDDTPRGVWPDSQPGFCNTIDPMDPDAITGFIAGSDRNQDGQLINVVDQLIALKAAHHIGDVRFSSVLLSNLQSISTCGPICDDVLGQKLRWPGPVAPPSNAAFAYIEARAILNELSTHGGGSFAEFADTAGLAAFGNAGLTGIDFDSLAALNVEKTFILQPMSVVAWHGAWELDQDSDGLPDAEEASRGTNGAETDSDGDGFDDRFEVERSAMGFDPSVRDARGCDPQAPLTLGCVARDSDGDGLSQFAEAFLGTRATMVDTDRDGLPDGLEVRFQLDPLTRIDPAADSDGDGTTDFDEVLRGTDPHFSDALLGGVTVSRTPRTQPNGSTCYDLRVTGLPMAAVPGGTGTVGVPAGVNLFKLWFAEAPDLVPEAAGRWRAACAFSRRDATVEPSVLVPANLDVTLFESHFQDLSRFGAVGWNAYCANQAALMP